MSVYDEMDPRKKAMEKIKELEESLSRGKAFLAQNENPNVVMAKLIEEIKKLLD